MKYLGPNFTFEYFGEFENVLIANLGPIGVIDWWKNRGSEISWHCLFKQFSQNNICE
jgi:hypothetical protein